ncbi:PHP domain-containing protein, partial [Haloquadratum walsbyi]
MTRPRGDSHVHTTASDGVDTLSERCARAREVDLPIFAVTDHD